MIYIFTHTTLHCNEYNKTDFALHYTDKSLLLLFVVAAPKLHLFTRHDNIVYTYRCNSWTLHKYITSVGRIKQHLRILGIELIVYVTQMHTT